MSPSKNALTREMLEKKQLRAEAARNESLKTREIKSQSLSSKINRVLTKKEEERRQLQRQLEDRLTEAEQRRSTILHERRGKTKEERAQQEFTKVTHDKKKVAAVEREEKIRARKMELEAGRQRKAEENAAKEEAALVRRNSMEKRRWRGVDVVFTACSHNPALVVRHQFASYSYSQGVSLSCRLMKRSGVSWSCARSKSGSPY